MDEKALVVLLRNIQMDKHAGVVSFDVLAIAEENGLIERTPIGNFNITEKGLRYLDVNAASDPLKITR